MTQSLILTINPGTTTTRIGLFAPDGAEVRPFLDETIEHDETVMNGFDSIAAQLPFRTAAIHQMLAGISGDIRLAAVSGRGGMLSPVPAGVIEVNDALVDFALQDPVHHHASNLGAPLAQQIARTAGCRAFIVDPVSVDELPPVARVSGFPGIQRFSFVHALNIRACGRRLAARIGKPFAELDAVVAHMGAGVSIAAISKGRIVDSTNRMENAPFTPERAGGLPPMPLIDMCYSGKFSKDELKRQLYGRGGVFAYLGTKDMRRVETMIASGDPAAQLVWDALVYQIGKAIGSMAAVLNFRPDAIVLTGGMANSERLTAALKARIGSLADVIIYPGSHESEALAAGAARVLAGTEAARQWPVAPEVEPMPW